MTGPLQDHGAPRSPRGPSPPLRGYSQLLRRHAEDDEQVQQPESLRGQGWQRQGSVGSPPCAPKAEHPPSIPAPVLT